MPSIWAPVIAALGAALLARVGSLVAILVQDWLRQRRGPCQPL